MFTGLIGGSVKLSARQTTPGANFLALRSTIWRWREHCRKRRLPHRPGIRQRMVRGGGHHHDSRAHDDRRLEEGHPRQPRARPASRRQIGRSHRPGTRRLRGHRRRRRSGRGCAAGGRLDPRRVRASVRASRVGCTGWRQPDGQRPQAARSSGFPYRVHPVAHQPGDLEPGSRVHVEADVIAKHVRRLLEPYLREASALNSLTDFSLEH